MSEVVHTSTSAAARERPPRSIYLDALRAVALVRVVIYHSTSQEWVTLFTAMPLMFFIAGSLYASSLDRRPASKVIRDRYRRILFPYWLYIVAMIGLWAALGVLGQLSPVDWVGMAFPVLSPAGPQGPGLGTEVELTWIALWYLQFHLVLSLVGPWLRTAQLRRPKAMWISILTAFVIGILGGAGVVVVIFYVACWLLGYHQHDGDLEAVLRRRWKPICLALGPPGLALYLAFLGSSEWSAVSLRLAALGATMLGMFWLALALGLRPALEPRLGAASTRATVHWFSQRSLTIYMWHMVAIYAALSFELPGVSNPLARFAWCAALTVLVVPVVGWAEDLAARRSPTLWPRPAAISLR